MMAQSARAYVYMAHIYVVHIYREIYRYEDYTPKALR